MMIGILTSASPSVRTMGTMSIMEITAAKAAGIWRRIFMEIVSSILSSLLGFCGYSP